MVDLRTILSAWGLTLLLQNALPPSVSRAIFQHPWRSDFWGMCPETVSPEPDPGLIEQRSTIAIQQFHQS